WSANHEGNVAGYRVYRAGSSGGPFTLLTTNLLTSPSYNDLLAPGGATSYYRVTAVDTNGGESPAATASATRTGGGVTLPAAPSGLGANPIASTQVNLVWTDNSNNETGFKVQRRDPGSSTFNTIFTTAAGATSYSDTSVLGGN